MMGKKNPCCAKEGWAYPGNLGVKAGLHSEAYWLRLRPVWTDKAAVWSHLTTAPEARLETFIFFSRLSASNYFHLCHWSTDLLCCLVFVCLICRAFSSWRETGPQKRSLSGLQSLASVSAPFRVPFVGFCKHLSQPDCTWLTLTLGPSALAGN